MVEGCRKARVDIELARLHQPRPAQVLNASREIAVKERIVAQRLNQQLYELRAIFDAATAHVGSKRTARSRDPQCGGDEGKVDQQQGRRAERRLHGLNDGGRSRQR